MKTISKDINITFGLEKCATYEKDITELGPRKAYRYLGVEESHDMKHQNEKEKLKKEYLRR